MTIYNWILLFLFVLVLIYGIYILVCWKSLTKSNKEKEREFYDWLNQVEEDLKKEKEE